jgi:dTDP-4-amino-4,6-dideoxygalactose transaminase
MTRTVDTLPALLGGTPTRPDGPPPWPVPDDDVRTALNEVYRSGSWGKYHGDHVQGLEARLAEYHGIRFALSCASGTFAVELALGAVGISAGDEVLMAAYDYPGNFLNIHALGARPVLLDVHPRNLTVVADQIPGAVSPSARALIVSHLHGGMAPMREIVAVAHANGLKVIEDAAQVPGALCQGRKAGVWGDVGTMSFGGSKLLTAGRGGCLLTNHPEIYQRARTLTNRGNQVAPLSELQAAVLLPQLEKLDARNRVRGQNVAYLRNRLARSLVIVPFMNELEETQPAYYKVGFKFDAAACRLSRDRFLAAARAEGLAFDEGFQALHVGRSAKRYRAAGALTEAEKSHHGTIILHHPVLLGELSDMEQIAVAFEKILAHAERLSKL